MTRRLLLLPVLALVLVVLGGTHLPAGATSTTVPSGPSTTLPVVEDGGMSMLPRPNSGREPQQPGDRGGSLQTLVFVLIAAGMGTVFFVISRSTAKRTRAAQAAMDLAEGRTPQRQ